jgi:hypothetical protein
MDTPSPAEMNTVALFVVAARELKTCRFWMEEHGNLKCVVEERNGTPNVRYCFPDPETVAAAVLAFRKLWSDDEACYHATAKNVIYRHCPHLRCVIDDCWQNTTGMLAVIFRQHGVDVPAGNIVGLWLNTRFLHIGKGRRKSRFTREGFKEIEAAVGPSRFEYCFLTCIWNYGVYLQNLANIAEAFLRRCEENGWSPDLDIRPQAPSADVQRGTPGFEQGGVPVEQLCWRLRRLGKYRVFADVADRLGVTDASLATHTCRFDSFPSFCQSLGVGLVHQEKPPVLREDDVVYYGTTTDEHARCIEVGRVRQGLWALTRDRQIRWSGEWLDMVEEQYAMVRREVSTFLGQTPLQTNEALAQATPSPPPTPPTGS